MQNISDIIEKFIIASMGDSNSVEISRNALAEHFSCVPSQINYVLDTRFTVDKGFVKESKRGGSGYIKISRIDSSDKNKYLTSLLIESVGDELSGKRLGQILDKLLADEIIDEDKKVIIETALSDDSLEMPFTIKEKVRAKSFKNILLKLMIKN